MPAYPIKKILDTACELKLELGWDFDIIYISTDIQLKDLNEIPDHIGIYILKDKSDRRYIGCTKNIKRRQWCHHVKDVVTIDVYLIENVVLAEILEKQLIRDLNPELNKTGNPAYYRMIKETGRHRYNWEI